MIVIVMIVFQDEEADDCNKGEGHDVESDEDVISVDYSCGSMVWVKFSGWYQPTQTILTLITIIC